MSGPKAFWFAKGAAYRLRANGLEAVAERASFGGRVRIPAVAEDRRAFVEQVARENRGQVSAWDRPCMRGSGRVETVLTFLGKDAR